MNVHELSNGIGIRRLLKNCVCVPAFTGSSQCSGESTVVFLCILIFTRPSQCAGKSTVAFLYIPSFYPVYSDFTGSSQSAGKSTVVFIYIPIFTGSSPVSYTHLTLPTSVAV